MNTVQSKYKNPDKYIALLKRQVDEAWRASRENYKRYSSVMGEYITSGPSLLKGENAVLSYYGTQFDNLTPGDHVSIVCEVTAVMKSYDEKKGTKRRLSRVSLDAKEIRTRSSND